MAISLSSIKTGVRLKPPKVVCYGVGGIGKTTWAAGAPSPIFLFTEEGQGLLDLPRFELREGDPVLRSHEEVLDCVRALYNEEHNYRTLVLDTADFWEPMLQQHTATKHGKANIESFGYGKGFRFAVDEACVLLDWFDALRRDRNMAIVILCHAETKRFDSPEFPSYERYKLRLQDQLAAKIHDWADALLFANYRVHVVKDDDTKKEKMRGVGEGERLLFTEERPAYWAKNRYNLPRELPLSWKAFQDSIASRVVADEPKNEEPQQEPQEAAEAAKE